MGAVGGPWGAVGGGIMDLSIVSSPEAPLKEVNHRIGTKPWAGPQTGGTQGFRQNATKLASGSWGDVTAFHPIVKEAIELLWNQTDTLTHEIQNLPPNFST